MAHRSRVESDASREMLSTRHRDDISCRKFTSLEDRKILQDIKISPQTSFYRVKMVYEGSKRGFSREVTREWSPIEIWSPPIVPYCTRKGGAVNVTF